MTEERKVQIVKKLKKRIFNNYKLNQMDNDALEDDIEHMIIEEIRDE